MCIYTCHDGSPSVISSRMFLLFASRSRVFIGSFASDKTNDMNAGNFCRRLFPLVGRLLRKSRAAALGGEPAFPPPHTAGDGQRLLDRLLPTGMPSGLTPYQVFHCNQPTCTLPHMHMYTLVAWPQHTLQTQSVMQTYRKPTCADRNILT
jgi:hypothetical protein